MDNEAVAETERI